MIMTHYEIIIRNILQALSFQEFAKGGLVKGGLAIYVFPLCNCNILGSVVECAN